MRVVVAVEADRVLAVVVAREEALLRRVDRLDDELAVVVDARRCAWKNCFHLSNANEPGFSFSYVTLGLVPAATHTRARGHLDHLAASPPTCRPSSDLALEHHGLDVIALVEHGLDAAPCSRCSGRPPRAT